MAGKHYALSVIYKTLERIRAGESQAVIAKETGIGESTISMWRLKHGLRSKREAKAIIMPRMVLSEAPNLGNLSKLSRETLAAIVRDLLK